jgi:GTP-binding protein HflX
MIDTEKDNRKLVERAILIGLHDNQTDYHEAEEHLEELEELVKNLDIPVIDRLLVNLKVPMARYLLGSGKAEEIAELADEQQADCLIFDGELSPSQQRNWEKLTKKCVIDRQEVILDIFANRASTREAVLQVELARMQYSLPRLTRAWTHLSRQRGGAKGTRGEGEKQIEADRRMVQQRISQLHRELKEVRKHRQTQRKSRERHQMPHAAIVGYTNAGKSSLLNRLCDSNVLVEDKLFATLDPTTRKVKLSNNQELLLTDTVGFVRKLPHGLVEAFKSTLEEAILADFLILVLDVSSPNVEEHWATTLSVLSELGAEDKRTVIIFNKLDLQDDPVFLAKMRSLHPDTIFISTVTKVGLDKLEAELIRQTRKDSEIIRLRIPPDRHDLISLAHSKAKIIDSNYEENGYLNLTVIVNQNLNKKFAEFQIIPE